MLGDLFEKLKLKRNTNDFSPTEMFSPTQMQLLEFGKFGNSWNSQKELLQRLQDLVAESAGRCLTRPHSKSVDG